MRLPRSWSAPVICGAVIVAMWEGAIAASGADSFLLPPPSKILAALAEHWSTIVDAASVTGFVIVTGFVGGAAAGIALALLVTRSRLAAETVTPLAVAISAVPIIALAPIFKAWFGLLSPRPNQFIVVILVFFPVFVNTAKGLTQVEANQIELMHTYAASPWRIMREVRVPNALPYVFTSLKIGSSLAVIAAIVAEYFGGRQDSLGNLITSSATFGRYAQSWAAVLAGTTIGTALYVVVVLVERRAIPWHASVRHVESTTGG